MQIVSANEIKIIKLGSNSAIPMTQLHVCTVPSRLMDTIFSFIHMKFGTLIKFSMNP